MSPTQNLIFLVVFIVCMTQTLSLFDKIRVHVINGFSTNDTLSAHCKSKDDDLGLRNLAAHSEFNWTFRTDIREKTRFTCHMWWKAGQKTLDVFWVDEKLIDGDCNSDCHWMAEDDGIYLYSFKHGAYRLMEKWEPWPK